MNRKEVSPLKKNVAKVISGTVKNIARISSITGCNWITYQPKVPQKLLEKK
jgi:cyclic lactone autoinducer peptide